MNAAAWVLIGSVVPVVGCAWLSGRWLAPWAGRWWWADLAGIGVTYGAGVLAPPLGWVVVSWPPLVDLDGPWFALAGLYAAAVAGLATVVGASAAGLVVAGGRPRARDLGVGVATGLATAALSLLLLYVARRWGAGASEIPPGVLDMRLPEWARWGAVGLVVGVVPLIEEALFRGAVFGVLARRFGAPVALTVTAAAFGLAHGSDVAVLASTLAYGVAWGYLRARTGSIWAGVVAHLTTNLLALLTTAVG